mgnify:CR=1 FL=1
MAIDKSIDYVEQDGSLNFIKNSESVTVPKKFKARKNAPKVKLAYITDAEAKMLKKKKPGTPHKGPKGIPSYDTFGSIDRDTGRDTGVSGETASGFERGDSGERSRADARAAGFSPQDVQDFRSAAIAAGAGQRVNPGFFDSRDTVSPAELRAAKAINPTAFKAGRRGGIMDFITSGGFLGNLVRGLGQRLGLGKRFNEPTYDMSQFNNLGLFGQVPEDFENDPKISNVSFTQGSNVTLPESNNRFLGFPIGTGTNTTGPVVTDDRITTGVVDGPYANFNDYLEVPTNTGLVSTQQFKDSPFAQADFTDYMGNYTNMMENNVPVSNDEQMFIDNEIAANRFN